MIRGEHSTGLKLPSGGVRGFIEPFLYLNISVFFYDLELSINYGILAKEFFGVFMIKITLIHITPKACRGHGGIVEDKDRGLG